MGSAKLRGPELSGRPPVRRLPLAPRPGTARHGPDRSAPVSTFAALAMEEVQMLAGGPIPRSEPTGHIGRAARRAGRRQQAAVVRQKESQLRAVAHFFFVNPMQVLTSV